MYDQEKRYYVYGYQREKHSHNGFVGTYYYIGKGTGHRAWDRNHTIMKPNDPNRIIIIQDSLTEADALQIEVLLIAFFGRVDLGTGILRNLTNGGEGTCCKSPQSIETCAEKHRGAKRSIEARRKMSEAAKRRANTPEHKERFRKVMSDYRLSDQYKAKKTFSAEARRRMSAAALIRANRPEHKEKFKIRMASVHGTRSK